MEGETFDRLNEFLVEEQNMAGFRSERWTNLLELRELLRMEMWQ